LKEDSLHENPCTRIREADTPDFFHPIEYTDILKKNCFDIQQHCQSAMGYADYCQRIHYNYAPCEL